MLRVVADTNILVSATISKGSPEKVVNLALSGHIKLILSEEILQETTKVLLKKLSFPPAKVEMILTMLREIALVVSPRKKLNIIKEKETDNRILECAVEGRAHYIVSGDTKHLQPLKEYRGIKILSPTEFLNLEVSSE